MKKLVALLLTVLMLLSIFSGCAAQKPAETPADTPANNTPSTNDPAQGDDPPAEEPVEMRTVKILCTKNLQTMYPALDYGNWENNETYQVFTAELAKRGIQLEFEVIDQEQYADSVKPRLISGIDLPDIIYGPNLSDTEGINLGKSGVVADVMALINEYDEDGSILAYMEEVSGNALSTIIDDGKMYWFPYTYGQVYMDDDGNIMPENYGSSVITPSIRKDWLDACGLEYKTNYTPDELADTLIALYENDANGNGVKDEVLGNFRADFKTGFEACFGMVYGIVNSANDGQGIRCNVYSEQYPDYIRFLQKLYQAGVLDTTVLNGTDVINSNRASTLNGYAAEDWLEEGITGFEKTALYAPFVMDQDGVDNGFSVAYCDAKQNVLGQWFVNAESKNLEAVVDLMDYVYTHEYADLAVFGLEGKTYEIKENGTRTFLPGHPNMEEGTTVYPLESTIAANALPNNSYNIITRDAVVRTDNEYYQVKYDFIDWIWDRYDTVTYCHYSPLCAVATDEENEIINKYASEIKTYLMELNLDLIIGAKSLDDLPKYISELESMGLTEYLAAYSARYDRYQQSLAALEG